MVKEAIVVIFGCRHYEEYIARVDEAICLVLERKLDPIFIFTGIDSPIPRRILDVFGDGRIISDNVSRETEGNVRNTLKLINQNWLNDLEVFLVSSWYHFPKIKLFLSKYQWQVPESNLIKSYHGIKLINIAVEPFALLAAYTGISRWPIFRKAKLALGYNV